MNIKCTSGKCLHSIHLLLVINYFFVMIWNCIHASYFFFAYYSRSGWFFERERGVRIQAADKIQPSLNKQAQVPNQPAFSAPSSFFLAKISFIPKRGKTDRKPCVVHLQEAHAARAEQQIDIGPWMLRPSTTRASRRSSRYLLPPLRFTQWMISCSSQCHHRRRIL